MRWLHPLLLWSLVVSHSAVASEPITCATVQNWLTDGEHTEARIVQEIGAYSGRIPRNIGDCLGDLATPLVLDALHAKIEGRQHDVTVPNLYRVDLGDGALTEKMGRRLAQHVRLTWNGEVPYVVLFDDDVFETPDWFFDYRDLLTLEFVARLPAGSKLASDPLAMGDEVDALLDVERRTETRTRLRNAGFRRLLFVRRGRGEDPETLTVEVQGEDLWSAQEPFVRVEFAEEPPEPVVPERILPWFRPRLSKGWFGVGGGIVGGVQYPGGTGVFRGNTSGNDEEQAARAAKLDVRIPLSELQTHRAVLGGQLALAGRISIVRMEADVAWMGLVPPVAFHTSSLEGGVRGTLSQSVEFGAFVGAGYGSKPVMAYLGWWVGGQQAYGDGSSTIGVDPGELSFLMPLQPATGPQVVVDLYADRFGQDASPGYAVSLMTRASVVAGLPSVSAGVRVLWQPVR